MSTGALQALNANPAVGGHGPECAAMVEMPLEMIKTILVPTRGTSKDASVFATALALARPLGAHLEFLHIPTPDPEPAAAGARAPTAARGGLGQAREARDLHRGQGATLAALAARARSGFEEFCRAHEIMVRKVPSRIEQISASWAEEWNQPELRLFTHARYRDLVVVGRPDHRDLMPNSLIQQSLLDCGCPVVIAPERPPAELGGTVVVGWKETSGAARALIAALPLLQQARRVVLVSIREQDTTSGILGAIARLLEWHGVAAETHFVDDRSIAAATRLPQIAADLSADLLVVGGSGQRYWGSSQSRLREDVLGGVTRTLIEHADLPVFMLH